MSDFKEGDHQRDKDGKFSAGGGGGGKGGTAGGAEQAKARLSSMRDKSGKLTNTTADMDAYNALLKEHGGNHKAAAKDYYASALQGTSMEARTEEGKATAHFTGTGWQEIKKNMRDDPIKAALVPEIPHIIKEGQYATENPWGNHPETKVFHTYRKKMPTSEGEKMVIVDVAERTRNKPEFSVYSLTREGTRAYEKRVGTPTVDSGRNLRSVGAPTLDGKILPRTLEVVNIRFADEETAKDAKKQTIAPITLDAATRRHYDNNGFLHVALSPISKEVVNPYYGREIPGWEERGLDPERIYHGYRAGDELAAAADSFNNLPLMLRHYVVTPDNPEKEHQVGSLGTDAEFNAPYLTNSLIITDAAGIRAVEDGTASELSAAYAYEPDFTPGEFEGQPYDFVMRNIRGNHVALGNLGDHKSCRSGVSEMRVDVGPGYRVYSFEHGQTLVVLLCGGMSAHRTRI